ncbi:MAG: hypothetical protein CVU77_04105 [Elusimicrobia bacterium HGW-Elusimicrobia-1]|jgi:HEAT repeat protein|nr:MAG: hypothetical protein CVU77_04105 [Elusimicrobia bacterium HGW-Elusimicrobia-1]
MRPSRATLSLRRTAAFLAAAAFAAATATSAFAQQDFRSLKTQYDHGLAEKRAEALAAMSSHKTPESLSVLKTAALDGTQENRVRIAAVEALGAFGGREAFEGVLRAMGDRDESVRRRARAIALASRNDAVFEALRDFISIARNDTILSREILSAMAELSPGKTIPVFKSLSHDNDNIRYGIIRVLPSMEASDTATMLSELFLGDEVAEIRAEAARAAAKLKIYSLLDKVLILLTDKSPHVREVAAKSLEDLADPEAMVYWLDAFKSPRPKIRAFAAAIVCRMGKAEAMPQVFPLLGDKSAEVRETATAGIASIFSPREHVFFMINELSSKNLLKRKTALRLLASSNDYTVVPALFSAMQSERDADIIASYSEAAGKLAAGPNISDIRVAFENRGRQVRIAAANALAAVSRERYPEAFAVFLAHIKVETDPEVIKAILSAFTSMKPAPYRLAYVWTSGRWPNEVKISAAEFLGNYGAPDAIGALMPAAENPSQEIAWRGRDAIEKLVTNPDSATTLSEYLTTRNKAVRLFILGTLKKYPSAAAVNNFSKINYSEADTETRYAMVEVIRALKPEGGHPLLTSALRDGSAEIRWLAAKTAAETAGDDASKFLANSLSDSSPAVREEALRSLTRNPKFENAARIRPYLSDSDISVRRAALEALEHIADEDSLKIIQNMLRDQDASVRALAAGIIGRAGISQARDTLRKMAETDLYPEARRAAAKALAAIGNIDAKTIEALFLLVKDNDSSVRTEAAAILNSIIDKSHKPYIIKSLLDENTHARTYALSAIAGMRLYEANTELFNLVKMMRREKRAENREILSTLALLIDEGDVTELTGLYDMNNPDIKLWVIEQTGKLKSEAAANLAARALREENPAFRQKALESLSAAKHPKVREAIKYIADNDPDPVLRRGAAEKLK